MAGLWSGGTSNGTITHGGRIGAAVGTAPSVAIPALARRRFSQMNTGFAPGEWDTINQRETGAPSTGPVPNEVDPTIWPEWPTPSAPNPGGGRPQPQTPGPSYPPMTPEQTAAMRLAERLTGHGPHWGRRRQFALDGRTLSRGEMLGQRQVGPGATRQGNRNILRTRRNPVSLQAMALRKLREMNGEL